MLHYDQTRGTNQCPIRLQRPVFNTHVIVILAEGQDIADRALTLALSPKLNPTVASQRYMKLHQAYLVTSLEGTDAWKHPTSFSLGIGAAVHDVGFKDYDLRYTHLCNTCLPCRVRRTGNLHGGRTSPSGCRCANPCGHDSQSAFMVIITSGPVLHCIGSVPHPFLQRHRQ